MRDDSLVEPFAVDEIFVDGFSDHVITNGMMSCAGYRLQTVPGSNEEHRVVRVRLVFPAAAVEEAIEDVRQALAAPVITQHRRARAKGH